MMIEIALALVASGVLYFPFRPMFQQAISAVFGAFANHRQKQVEAAASVATKKAVDGDVLNTHLFERVEKLEARLEEYGERLQKAELDAWRYQRLFCGVCRSFEELRSSVQRVARRLKKGLPVDAETLDALENTPSLKDVLKAVEDPFGN
jgi:hypothetical protein